MMDLHPCFKKKKKSLREHKTLPDVVDVFLDAVLGDEAVRLGEVLLRHVRLLLHGGRQLVLRQRAAHPEGKNMKN